MGIIDGIKRRVQESERRAHARHTSDSLRVLIENRRYKTVDWSLGGFKLERCKLTLSAKDRVHGKIDFDASVDGEFVAEVVHVSETGDIGFRFLEISPRLFLAMGGAFID